MGRLIDDLLTFSRMGRTEVKHLPVRLDRLVDEVRPCRARVTAAPSSGTSSPCPMSWVIPTCCASCLSTFCPMP
jgi:hypothetical protein